MREKRLRDSPFSRHHGHFSPWIRRFVVTFPSHVMEGGPPHMFWPTFELVDTYRVFTTPRAMPCFHEAPSDGRVCILDPQPRYP